MYCIGKRVARSCCRTIAPSLRTNIHHVNCHARAVGAQCSSLHTTSTAGQSTKDRKFVPKRPDPGTSFGVVSTRGSVEGRRIVKEIGVVSAGDFRSKNLFQDVHAAILAIFGGETPAYSDLIDEASSGSTYKLMREAQSLGATDVVNVRYQTTSTMNRLIFGMHVSVMGYGTAVVTEPIEGECEATYCTYRPSDSLHDVINSVTGSSK